MSDFPFFEAAAQAQALMNEGHTIHQKFTCHRCGTRQTISEANKFFTKGECEECGAVTNIVATGCNYVLFAEVQ